MSPTKLTRIIGFPAAVAVLALGLTACGSPGSSGTKDADTVTGKGCEPIAGDTLVALEDDKNLQASENILAAFNAEAADPEALAAVNAVAANLTTEQLTELNKTVDVDRKTPAKAAKAFAEETKLAQGLDKASGDIVVGHANYTESQIVANLYGIALKAAGYSVDLKDVGNRETYLPALKDNDFQVIPEYAASLAETLNPDADADSDPIADSDIDKTMETLTPFAKDAGLKLGEPAKAASQNAYVVTGAFAEEHDVTTLSDFAEKCSGKASTLAGPPECPTRPYCQLGLEETYGIQFGDFKTLDLGTATKKSVAGGESTVGTVTTTDSALADGVTVD